MNDILIPELNAAYTPVRAASVDFDGTISTLRCGWEAVMEQTMLRRLLPSGLGEKELLRRIRAYIGESAGIQTVYQMEWLAGQVRELCGAEPLDAWAYKDEYNEALLEMVNGRIRRLETGEADPADFLVPGSVEYLRLLREHGAALYIASGTDDANLRREAELLGIRALVTEVRGAPHRQKNCSKEAVIRALTEDGRFRGRGLMVVGDGKVEIRLGHEKGAVTVGLATRELRPGEGLNPQKRDKLAAAGADYLFPDFRPLVGLWRA